MNTKQLFLAFLAILFCQNIHSQTSTSPTQTVCWGSVEPYKVLANLNSTYQWKVLSAPSVFGTMDSLVSPQNDSISIVWNGAVGTYDLQVIEIDSNGCEGTPSIVSVNLVSQPSAISTNNVRSCVNGPISTLNVAGSNINWYNDTLGSPSIFNGNTFNTGQTVVSQYTYYVTETNTSGCESKYASISLDILPNPNVTLTPSDSSVCLNDSLFLTASGASSYIWFNGVSSSVQGIIADSVGINNFNVIGQDSLGCSDTTSIIVQVDQLPNVLASPAISSICLGDSIEISASGAVNYLWNNGAVNSNQFVSPGLIGNNSFIVSGTDGNSCSNSDTLSIFVNNLPIALASASDTNICINDTITLSSNAASNYQWSTGSTNQSQTLQLSTLGINIFSVTILDTNFCSATDSVTVNVNNNPTINATANNTNICIGESVTLNASGASSYQWDNGVTSSTQVITPSTSAIITYSVVGTDANSCSANAQVNINVNPLPNTGPIFHN
tara:strand:+ start:974 stop:2467 length:1494 start_codon:yes stop_codon:yes gene_type:complete